MPARKAPIRSDNGRMLPPDREESESPQSDKPVTLSKGRYAIYQTPTGDGVISYRPDGEEKDQHQVVPARFWSVCMGILSGQVTDLNPMALMKMLMGGQVMAGSPWTNQVVSLIILAEETTGFSGLFGYSPTPGAGNLIFSIAASSGTDQYGNAYIAGITSYEGSTYTSISGGQAQLSSGSDYQAAQLGAGGTGESFLSSGLASSSDIGSEVILQSQSAAGGESTVTLSAALVNVILNLTVNGGLTVNEGATITGGLTVDTINGSSTTGGPNGTGFFNTQGLASGSYGSTHQHTLPDFPTATHTHNI